MYICMRDRMFPYGYKQRMSRLGVQEKNLGAPQNERIMLLHLYSSLRRRRHRKMKEKIKMK